MTLSKDTSSQQQAQSTDKPLNGWRLKLYNIIFEAETPAGRRFDLALLVLILLSVAVVFADSVQELRDQYGNQFKLLE